MRIYRPARAADARSYRHGIARDDAPSARRRRRGERPRGDDDDVGTGRESRRALHGDREHYAGVSRPPAVRQDTLHERVQRCSLAEAARDQPGHGQPAAATGLRLEHRYPTRGDARADELDL